MTVFAATPLPGCRRFTHGVALSAALLALLAGCGDDRLIQGAVGDVAADVAADSAPAGPACSADSDCTDDGDLCNGRVACIAGHCALQADSVVHCDASKDGICGTTACVPATGACALWARNDGAACEDGDPCTVADRCASGVCAASGVNACECDAKRDCAAHEDGDACNGTLFCDVALFPYRCKVNPGTVVDCSAADEPCKLSACDPKSGKCVVTPAADGGPCSDGDPCTIGDACSAGSCAAGPDNTCICTTSADCASKEDGDVCNGTLFCDTGASPAVCKVNPATVVVCPSAGDTACVTSACVADTGLCQPIAANAGTPCDDGDACTGGDHCLGGLCQASAYLCTCSTDADCLAQDDGDKCNGVPFCDQATGKCAPNPASVVHCQTVDDTACAMAVCLPKEGTCTTLARADVIVSCDGQGANKVCSYVPKQPGQVGDSGPFPCDDGNVCTSGDVCEGKECKSAAITCECSSNADCAKSDDGDLCNGIYYCDKSLQVPKCVFNPASAVFCSHKDDTDCLTNQCDAKTGGCGLQPAKSGKSCEDGNLCTSNTACDGAGECSGDKVDCDDGNLCTLDSCKPASGCIHTASACSDANDCTVDTCDPKTGACTFDAAAKAGKKCNGDDSGCTVNDACDAKGVCKVGSAVICSLPVQACQVAGCVPQGAESFACAVLTAPDGTDCDDGDACTLASECTQGTCDGGAHEAYFVTHLQPGTMLDPPQSELSGRIADVTVLADGSALYVGEAWTGQAGAADSVRMGWRILTDTDGRPVVERLSALPTPDPLFHVAGIDTVGPAAAVVIADIAVPNATRTLLLVTFNIAGGSAANKLIGDFAKQEQAVAIVGNDDGGATFLGMETTGVGTRAFLGRTNVQLVQLWRADVELPVSVVPTSLALAGTDTVGAGRIGSLGKSRGWIFRHNDKGELLWQRSVGELGDTQLRNVGQSPSGAIIAAGWTAKDLSESSRFGILAVVSAAGTPQGVDSLVLNTWFNDGLVRPDGLLVGFGAIGADAPTGTRAYVTAGDENGNLAWVHDPPPLEGYVDEETVAAGLHSSGALYVAGTSTAVGGGSVPWLGRFDPWGHKSCKTSGACAGKTYQDCDDGSACTVDACVGQTGCINYASAGLLCAPGDGCHFIGLCQGKTCTPGPATKLHAFSYELPGVTAVSAVAAMPDGGVAIVGRVGAASNVSVRLNAFGQPIGQDLQPVAIPLSSEATGIGAVAVAPIGGDIGVLGHASSGSLYPQANVRRVDLAGATMWTWQADPKQVSVGQDLVRVIGSDDVWVAFVAKSLHVTRLSQGGKALSTSVGLPVGTLDLPARLAPTSDGGVLVAASLADGDGKTLQVAAIDSAGKVLLAKALQSQWKVQLSGLTMTAFGVVCTGRALVAPNTWHPWAMLLAANGTALLELVGDAPGTWSGTLTTPTGLAMVDRASAEGVSQLRLVGTDAAGNATWARIFGAPATDIVPAAVDALDIFPDGGLLLAGVSAGTTGAKVHIYRTDAWGFATCTDSGGCAGKGAADCADLDPCTLDACDPKLGCTHSTAPNLALCGLGKVCVNGGCVSAP